MKAKSEKSAWNPTKSSDKAKIAITILIAVILLLGILAAVVIGMNRRLQKADTYVAQGNQYYAQSEYDQAEQCYKKAISLKKKDANAYLLLGKTYLAQDDSDSAIAILESGYKATKDAAIEQEISNLKRTETASSGQTYAAAGTTASEDAAAFGQSGTALANSGTPNTPGEQVQSAVNVPQVDADTLEKFAAQTEPASAEESGGDNSGDNGDSSADAEASQADSAEHVKQAANASENSEADTQAETAAVTTQARQLTGTQAAQTTAQNQTSKDETSRTTTRLETTESETETTATTTGFFEKREDGAYVYTDLEGKKHRISARHVELMHNFWKHQQTETTTDAESTASEQTTTETVTTTKPKTTARKTTDAARENTTQTTAVTTEPIAKTPTYEEEFDNWLESLIYALFLRNIIS